MSFHRAKINKLTGTSPWGDSITLNVGAIALKEGYEASAKVMYTMSREVLAVKSRLLFHSSTRAELH